MSEYQAATPGEAAYNRWRAMTVHSIATWDKLPSAARWTWEKVAQAARAFEMQKQKKA